MWPRCTVNCTHKSIWWGACEPLHCWPKFPPLLATLGPQRAFSLLLIMSSQSYFSICNFLCNIHSQVSCIRTCLVIFLIIQIKRTVFSLNGPNSIRIYLEWSRYSFFSWGSSGIFTISNGPPFTLEIIMGYIRNYVVPLHVFHAVKMLFVKKLN